MSKPVMESLFSFQGRRNRKSYNLATLLRLAVFFALIGLSQFSQPAGMGNVSVFNWFIAIMFILLSISSLATGSQRCRDFDASGLTILFTLIPFIGLLFAVAIMFIPGTRGSNSFGPDPLSLPTGLPLARA